MMRMFLLLGWLAGWLAPMAVIAQTSAVPSVANGQTNGQEAVDEGVTADGQSMADQRVVAEPDVIADSSAIADQRERATAGGKQTAPEQVGQPAAARPAEAGPIPETAQNGNGSPQVIEIPIAAEESALLPEGAEVMKGGNTNLISITLDALPVIDVVNMFSKISGANIIVAGTITNAIITANLKNVEWKAALALALGSVNLSLIEDPSGILMVVTSEMYREKLQQIENTKPLVTKSFAVNYLNAVDFIEQIKLLKILSPRGTIIGSQSREQDRLNLKSSALATEVSQNPSITTEIIITDIKEYVDKVEKLIRDLDKREPQVFIEARIIDVVSDDSKKLGFDWEMLDRFGATMKIQDLKWSFSDDHNLVNSTLNKDNQFDTRGNQDGLNQRYDIDGKGYQETTTTYEEQPPGSGNWVANTIITPTRTITDTINRGRDISSVKTDTLTDTRKETKMGTAILNVSDVSLFLSALQRSQNSEMISHPLIVVGNKVEAKIHVGQRYPTIFSTKQAANPQQGQTESFTERVEWNDLGLTLWVIPEIDHNVDVIRLTVNPSMSTWIKDITTPAGSVYPVISTRQVSTRANVPSKHTVVIGGLIDNQKGTKEKRVPILSDIPLLGLLFRHTEDIISKHNLLIMLTPTILDERAPLTGLETIAQQSVDRLEKTPLSPKKDPSLKPSSTKTISGQTTGLTGDVPTTPSSSANIVASLPETSASSVGGVVVPSESKAPKAETVAPGSSKTQTPKSE
ncbi:MAG: hypothetical protein L6455_13515 [Kiritimatiellae bacterium]|nr:hypothetical protein [Kiritimatiellia bacterium]